LNKEDYDIKRYKLSDQVYDTLKREIINGNLKKGEELYIDKITERLKVSKTPVREAVSKLIGEGLVVNTGKNKIKIIELTLDEISNICELREVLEILALQESFSKINKAKVTENFEMLKEAKKNLEKGNSDKFIIADNSLHNLIINSTNNKWLLQIVKQLRSLIDIVRNEYSSLDRYMLSVDEHIDIVNAILSKDKKASIKKLKKHLENAKYRIINSFKYGK